LIALYEAHAAHRDKFEVLAIHDRSVKSFAELDPKLAKIKERYWQGKDLPFPVLLDASGITELLYGIRAHPTGLLIDPEGKLVGEASPSDLEAKLPALPASVRWKHHRDIARFYSDFAPGTMTLNRFAAILRRWTGCQVELDAAALKASGLTPDGPLPGAVFGGVSLRSLDELLLAPHGLGVVAAADEKKLLITARPAKAEADSYVQKLSAREIADQLDNRVKTNPEDGVKPLEIKDEALLDALKRIHHEFGLNVALDARAMHNKTLDPQARVTGSIARSELRKSLTAMLDSLGLTLEVRQEVVFVTPKNK
jgi:hypothetical protein